MVLNSQIHYKRNILIAVIVSETLIISAFIFSPTVAPGKNIVLNEEPIFLIDEIPQTVQSLPVKKPRPEIPTIFLSDEIEEFDMLEDVNISLNSASQNNKTSLESTNENNIQLSRALPRLIFDVVPPRRNNEFNGELQLSLKINKKGQVVDHRIIFNSLDCNDCLNEVIKAAYSSKWEPAFVNGAKTDYWVVKSYTFN